MIRYLTALFVAVGVCVAAMGCGGNDGDGVQQQPVEVPERPRDFAVDPNREVPQDPPERR